MLRWVLGIPCICLGLLSTLDVGEASARSPLPYFAGVEAVGIICRSPEDVRLRDGLCETAREILSDQLAILIDVGTAGLNDRRKLHVLISGYLARSPSGEPVVIVSIDLLRAGHVDPRLYGPAPILLSSPQPDDTGYWRAVERALAGPLEQLVVRPLVGAARQ
ncbi:MAG: hypothetical protein HQ481_06330 [Alphaproteobacteria bacterium]|nr:hypothetical protein [Alphaproteobacteria bacterium]